MSVAPADIRPSSVEPRAVVPASASCARASTPEERALAALAASLPDAAWVALIDSDGVAARLHVRWPRDAAPSAAAIEIARRAAASGRVTRVPLAAAHTGGEEPSALLAVPLRGGERIVVALCRALDAAALGAFARRAATLAGANAGVARTPAERMRTERERPEPARPEPVRSDAPASPEDPFAVALAVAAAAESATSAALAVAESLLLHHARCHGLRRVSIGRRRAGRVSLLAVSGEARPDARRALPERLRAVMGEAFASANGEGLTAHRALHADTALAPLCCTHAGARGELVAVLERDGGRVLGDGERRALERAARASLGVVELLLGGRFARLGERIDERVSVASRRWRGRPGVRAAGLATLATLVLALLFVPLPHRVSGRVVVEASERQVLVAPRDGYIRSASARAGDRVVAGEVLAALDDRELVLEGGRWDGEAAKNGAERTRALATRDRVELARLRADAERIAAERDLIGARRARDELRAPFDGTVLSGDPTRSLGAAVSAGEVLFEVAASAKLSLSVEIDERDIALIEPGSVARVRMAASPRQLRRARLEPMVPVAVAEPGGSVFRVPATLLDERGAAELRPGMQGVARVAAGRRSLASAWTRVLRGRLLLLAWKLGLVA